MKLPEDKINLGINVLVSVLMGATVVSLAFAVIPTVTALVSFWLGHKLWNLRVKGEGVSVDDCINMSLKDVLMSVVDIADPFNPVYMGDEGQRRPEREAAESSPEEPAKNTGENGEKG